MESSRVVGSLGCSSAKVNCEEWDIIEIQGSDKFSPNSGTFYRTLSPPSWSTSDMSPHCNTLHCRPLLRPTSCPSSCPTSCPASCILLSYSCPAPFLLLSCLLYSPVLLLSCSCLLLSAPILARLPGVTHQASHQPARICCSAPSADFSGV